MRGYLMMEALVALLIAASTIGSLHALHLTIARDSRLAAERAFASIWAEQIIETTLAALRAGDTLPALVSSSWPLAADADPLYWRRIELTPVTEQAMRVEVSVAWPHPDASSPHRIVLSASVRPGASADGGWIPDGHPPVISP
jgi:Tfp pilus assembly protein PilV